MADNQHTGGGDGRSSAELSDVIRSVASPLRSPADLDLLLDRVNDARYVLLGEASHGTHEYYTWRTEISKRLIRDHGFSFIAVEGDWPDCYRGNRFIKHYGDSGTDTRTVLHAFHRWPTWMWANEEVVELVDWLRQYNSNFPDQARVGFYGLDMYSLWQSLYAIIDYLKKHDPEAVPAAYRAFHCFEPYGEEAREYARAALALVPQTCEEEVLRLLAEVQQRQPRYADGRDGRFNAEQNAHVLKSAEEYYRTAIHGGPDSWNLRDSHMYETLERLMELHGSHAKAIVWAHNTHIGDARFTDMAEMGEHNIGQLVRESHGAGDVLLVGFGSYEGSVIAGRTWDSPMQEMPVPRAQGASWEDIMHGAGIGDFLLTMDDIADDRRFLSPRGHRAIGVVYHPEREWSSYVSTILPKRYDAFLFLDQTRALSPLRLRVKIDQELPETYPWSV